MTTISDLSCDLVEEILSTVPITYLGAVRSTCKRWNTLSKSRLLCKAQADQQFVGFMRKNSKLCSLRFNLHEEEEFSAKEISNQVEISQVFVCNGLLLCVSFATDEEDINIQQRLMVWNPYLGQTRWIQPANTHYSDNDTYALGYDNNRCNHKILRYIPDGFFDSEEEYQIYDFESDSWKILDLDVTPDRAWSWGEEPLTVSLKGNTYFVDYDRYIETHTNYFICFDFTRERFGRSLRLPWSLDFDQTHSYTDFNPISSLGEEKLSSVLYVNGPISGSMRIWITTKIGPDEVLWANFLKIDLEAIPRFRGGQSFFVDEDNKRAVFFSSGCNYDSLRTEREYYNAAYVFGENNFFKAVDLGEIHDYIPVVFSNSYVPSLVQIKQNCTERQEEEESQETPVLKKIRR